MVSVTALVKGDRVKVACYNEGGMTDVSPNVKQFQLPPSSPIALPVYYAGRETEVRG